MNLINPDFRIEAIPAPLIGKGASEIHIVDSDWDRCDELIGNVWDTIKRLKRFIQQEQLDRIVVSACCHKRQRVFEALALKISSSVEYATDYETDETVKVFIINQNV